MARGHWADHFTEETGGGGCKREREREREREGERERCIKLEIMGDNTKLRKRERR